MTLIPFIRSNAICTFIHNLIGFQITYFFSKISVIMLILYASLMVSNSVHFYNLMQLHQNCTVITFISYHRPAKFVINIILFLTVLPSQRFLTLLYLG